ncbi:MAG: hypothetical protein ACKVIK_10325 [Rhodospirillales bacterium]|jgi:hypothetical protein
MAVNNINAISVTGGDNLLRLTTQRNLAARVMTTKQGTLQQISQTSAR